MSNCESCLVRKQSSLCALTAEEVEALDRSRVSYSLRKGESLFSEGENINGIFCVKEGACKMTKLSSNGNQQVVKLSMAGELLGQRSMISEEPAGLSAVALNDVQVCFIPREKVLQFFNCNNQFSMQMMKAICSDLREANSHLVNMAQKSVKQRLAGTLLYLHDTFGTEQDGTLKLKLSREELAGFIGTATESCIRLLSELQKEGKVNLSGKNISLIDINSLKRLNGH